MDIAEVMQARKELQMAQQDFMLADTEFIDVAIHRLNAAEQGKSVEGGKAGGDVFDSFYRCNYDQQRQNKIPETIYNPRSGDRS